MSRIAAGATCGAVAIILYLNTFKNGFCYDDKVAVLENKDLLPTTSWMNLLWNDFWGNPIHLSSSHKSYRPLCVASFRLNYMVHGLEPMGYHLVNVVLHAVVCYLYVHMCALVFAQVWPALLAGLLFAVHPIHTEAVAGVVGRADLMCAVFYLSCLLFYHYHVTTSQVTDIPHYPVEKPKGSQHFLVASVLCAICATLCKEIGITAIAVCLAFEVFFLKKNPFRPLGFNQPWRMSEGMSRGVVLTLCAGGLLMARILLIKHSPTFSELDNEALGLESPYRQAHWGYLVAVNAWLLLNPDQLIHDYRMNAITPIKSLYDTRNVATLCTLLAVVLLGVRGLYQTPLTHCKGERRTSADSASILLVGLILSVCPFIPASNLFFPVGFVVAERVLYLPSMGVCLVVAYSAHRMVTCRYRLVSAATTVALICLIATHSAKTITRNQDWESRMSLYSSLVHYYPNNGHMLVNIAKEYRGRGDYRRAELAYTRAMMVAPNLPSAYVNFGSMLKGLNRLDQAEEVLLKAVPLLVKNKDMRNVLASIYNSLCSMIARDNNRLEEAMVYCQKAGDTSAESSNIHNSLGAMFMQRGRNKDAINAFKKAAALNRSCTVAQYSLALLYINMGEDKLAMESLERVLSVDSTHSGARSQLDQLRKDIP